MHVTAKSASVIFISKVILLLVLCMILGKRCQGYVELLHVVNNDDYCDSDSDETHTSACSHRSNLGYSCLMNSLEKNITIIQNIPFSRLNDSICDCCDGSDEKNSVISSCPYTCVSSIPTYSLSDKTMVHGSPLINVSNTTALLIYYHTLQQGLKAKEYLFDNFNSKYATYMKVYLSYQQKVNQLENILLQLKIHYKNEIKIEKLDRISVLRERLYHCTIGFSSSCQYFSPSWLLEDTFPYPLESLDYSINPQYKTYGFLNKQQNDMRKYNISICLSRNIHSFNTMEYLDYMSILNHTDNIYILWNKHMPWHSNTLFNITHLSNYLTRVIFSGFFKSNSSNHLLSSYRSSSSSYMPSSPLIEKLDLNKRFNVNPDLLEGTDRIHQSCCLTTDIIPSSSHFQLFATLHDYLRNVNSKQSAININNDKGSKADSKNKDKRQSPNIYKNNINVNRDEMRKMGTLFGRFLNREKRGYLEGGIFIVEILAIILVPFTSIIKFIMIPYILMPFYSLIARSIAPFLYNTIFKMFMYDTYSSVLVKDLCGDNNTGNSFSYYWCISLIEFINQLQTYYDIYFDYRRYSLLMSFITYIHPVTLIPVISGNIIYNYPEFLYNYYIAYYDFQSLPQNQIVCILRTAMQYTTEELRNIKNKYYEYYANHISLSAQINDINHQQAKIHKTNINKNNFMKINPYKYKSLQEKFSSFYNYINKNNNGKSNMSVTLSYEYDIMNQFILPSYVDYGPNSEWWYLVIDSPCIQFKDFSMKNNTNNYQICIFDNVTINDDIVYYYLGWGSFSELKITTEFVSNNSSQANAYDSKTSTSSTLNSLRYNTFDIYLNYFSTITQNTIKRLYYDFLPKFLQKIDITLKKLSMTFIDTKDSNDGSKLFSYILPLVSSVYECTNYVLNLIEDKIILNENEIMMKYKFCDTNTNASCNLVHNYRKQIYIAQNVVTTNNTYLNNDHNSKSGQTNILEINYICDTVTSVVSISHAYREQNIMYLTISTPIVCSQTEMNMIRKILLQHNINLDLL